ncbi:hypothetical protein K0M31_001679 [Melipona bicolor]|uniref:Uncharacterized protein n=1 Tax=Melipona bicolor TaxID=60889 RepID=A0AA40GGT6_9HYME|nr:hypothetical protein K0M31_001679 [Melipona bicolor]
MVPFTKMRWFRGHAEAPRLLSLSPLQVDEDLDGASYHFHAASQYRGKNREKPPIQLPHTAKTRMRRELS